MNKKIAEKLSKISDKDPFLLTITVAKGGRRKKTQSFLIANKFPYEEFEETKEVLLNLIEEEQKKQFEHLLK